ncbi:MAG: hypothetical protein QM817_21700 [Archangium sp.]
MTIEDDFDTGDWMRAPWFTKGNAWREEFDALGLPLEERERLVPTLATVFDKAHCIAAHALPTAQQDEREADDEPKEPALLRVPELFGVPSNPASVAPRLWMASNLMTVGSDIASSYLRRLQIADSHDETAFELAVFGNLLRAGFPVKRIPEHKSDPRPDLLLECRGRRYEIEVKRTNHPDLSRMAAQLTQALRTDTLTLPGVRMTLLGSQHLDDLVLDRPSQFVAILPRVAREFRAAARTLKPNAAARIAVGELGEIVCELSERSAVADAILPDLRDAKKTSRVIRNIRKAASQFSDSSLGIVVVALSHFADAFEVEAAVVRLARHDEQLGRSRMVVLCDALYQPHGNILAPRPLVHVFCPRPFRRLSKFELEIAHTVASNPVGRAAAMPRSMRLATDRPKTAVVHLGTIELKVPGESATLTIGSSDLEMPPLPRRST